MSKFYTNSKEIKLKYEYYSKNNNINFSEEILYSYFGSNYTVHNNLLNLLNMKITEENSN